MERANAWYLSERAEQLAVMVFTRVPGVLVRHAPIDMGVDLIVMSADVPGRMFGVELKASTSISALITTAGVVRQPIAAMLIKELSHFPFPVGLLACGMQDDSNYFGWVLAPDSREQATVGTLRLGSSIVVQPATEEVISRAVAEALGQHKVPADGVFV